MAISPHIRRLRDAVGSELLVLPAVTGIVFDDRDRILLVRQAEGGVWTTPGGAVDPDELPADAVVREVWEETGLYTEPIRILGVHGGPSCVDRAITIRVDHHARRLIRLGVQDTATSARRGGHRSDAERQGASDDRSAARSHGTVRPKRRVVGLTLVAVSLAATWALLLMRGRSFVIATPGTSAEYWEYLCGVQIASYRGHHRYSRFGGTLPEVDSSLHYFDQLHHSQILYSVPTHQALGDAAAVRTLLFGGEKDLPESCDEDGLDHCADYWNGAERREMCRRVFRILETPASPADLRTFRAAVLSGEQARAREAEDHRFMQRLERGRRVWLTLGFEGIYLTAWWLFVAWGLLRVPRLVSWRWRIAVAPLLLFLPYFLGYAPMTFSFGPSGGFVYPAYLILACVPLHLRRPGSGAGGRATVRGPGLARLHSAHGAGRTLRARLRTFG